MTTRSFCVAGAICSMPPRSSRDLDPGVACDKSNVFDKRNVVVESMGCRGGENFDKKNVFDKRNVVVESMGCRGGGKL